MGILKLIKSDSKLTPLEALDREFSKSVWDVRNVPGVNYPVHVTNFKLDFTKIPVPYVDSVKQLIRLQIATLSLGYCQRLIRHIGYFLRFLNNQGRHLTHLQELSSKDLDLYLEFLRVDVGKGGKVRDLKVVWACIRDIEHYLEYLQRKESFLAPVKTISIIVWPEHRGKLTQARHNYNSESIKYIPQHVLDQIDQKIKNLKSHHRTIFLVLRASGWRISDVLGLRWDTCLVKTKKGWFLRGDIRKTKILNHKVPISPEIAAVIQNQIALVNQTYSDEDNPNHLLFPAPKYSKRTGYPVVVDAFSGAMNRFMKRNNIRDEHGKIFHFNTHTCRHTKAVDLINNGMPLIYVQQWLAHLSPQMTLVYAKLLDPRKQEEFAKAMERGAIRIRENGTASKVSLEELENELGELDLPRVRENLDSIRLPMGYCFKKKDFLCRSAEIPCFRCPAFVTTPEFTEQFASHIQGVEAQIQIGQQAGNVRWVEANQNLLNFLKPIYELLKSGKTHQKPKGKYEREYSEQEWTERQASAKSKVD